MIKNLLFDLGGIFMTLCRANSVRRFQALGVERADELLDAYTQNGIFLEVEEGKISAQTFCQRLGELAHRQVSYAEAEDAWLGFITDVPQYKLDYLLTLRRRGYRIDILSNTNPFILGWARSPRFSPDGHGLTHYVDQIYASYELGCVKPSEEIFRKALQQGELKPEETLFIDDSKKNVEQGDRMGLHTLWVENGGDFRPELEAVLKVSGLEAEVNS